MKIILVLLSMGFVLGACSHANCGAQKPKDQSALAASATGATVGSGSSTDKVKVYKADGSLQCGQGKKIDLYEMQKGLGTIKVYSSENKNDGMMRIQLCGTPTGNSNVYEIDRKDLEAALKLGFKEWTAE